MALMNETVMERAEPEVREVQPAGAGKAIATLVRAFAGDPAVRWMYPDPVQYRNHFPAFVRAFGGRAFETGTAFATSDGAGAALWLAPGEHPDEEVLDKVLQVSLGVQEKATAFELFEKMGAYHPREDHWYLALIGIDPARQGNGYGSALIGHVTAECDRRNRLAYLEASSPDTVPFYRKHGFEVQGVIEVGQCPPVVPMVRAPR